MIAGAHGIYGETRARCGVLCRDAENRISYGCDSRAKQALYRGTCPACLGGDPDCDECEGYGEAFAHRCPTSQVDRATRTFLDAYSWLERGVLPVAGALGDQSASFVEAVKLMDSERGLIRQAREKTDG